MPNPGPQSDAYLSLADELYFGGAAGGGKLLRLDEPVPVPGGWSSVGQLRVGDELFDENGHVCRVTALSAIDLNPKSYRLTFDDGTRIEACADHLWLTYSGNVAGVRTTQAIHDTLRVGGRVNHAIPVAGSLELPRAELLCDPYNLGLRAHRSGEIPVGYLRASREQRLEVLRGLMDVGGKLEFTRAVSYTSDNPKLLASVRELVVSLGWKVFSLHGGTLKWSPSEYVFRKGYMRNRQCVKLRKRERFRYIVACEPCESSPMRCIRVDSPNHLFLVSRSMVPTHNSMALIGMALTAHRNSLLLRRTAKDTKALSDSLRSLGYGRWKWEGNGGELVTPDNRVINVGGCQNIGDEQSYQGHAHDGKFFDELAHFAEQQYTFIIGWNRVRDPRRYPNQRCRVVGAGNPPTDPEGEWVLRRWRAWMPGADRPAKPGELRWYTTINGEEIECEDGKPITSNGVIYQPRSRTFIPARLEDNPELMRTGYAATLEALPEPLRSMMRYGDMMASRTDGRWQLIPTRWVVEAQKRWMERKDKLGVLRMAGCDVAMEGKDKTCLALRYGDPTPEKGATIGSIIRRKGTETPDGQTVVALFMGLDGTAIINIDTIGLGKSAYDVAVMMGLGSRVRAIVVSNAANWRDTRMPQIKFANLRAAMMWRVRSLLDPEGGAPETRLALPPDPELLGDLTAPNYSMRSGGIIVESKDEIKKRIGRSTDAGDSVALACWERPGYVVS